MDYEYVKDLKHIIKSLDDRIKLKNSRIKSLEALLKITTQDNDRLRDSLRLIANNSTEYGTLQDIAKKILTEWENNES